MEKFKESFKHLKKDPIMKTLIEKLGDKITLYDRKDEDLAKAISHENNYLLKKSEVK